MRRITLVALVFPAFLLSVAACGPAGGRRPELGKVSGKVTYKGKPIAKGEVIFTPSKDKGGASGQVATGTIESDGSYSLTTFDTGDGAILGQHVVTVIVPSQDLRELNKPRPDGSIPYILPKGGVPEKYSNVDTSPFRYTVDPGQNTINLELKD
jgi:hypothetical protein